MGQQSRAPDPELRFRTLYELVRPDLVRFIQRRAHPDHADDVAADTMLVVWRRLDEVPNEPDDARAWIFGVARNLLLNAQRGDQRRLALGVRLSAASVSAATTDIEADLVASRVDLAQAWGRLATHHQEALGLAVFEELTAAHAGTVLGISPVAFRLRLSRARRALNLHLQHQPRLATTAERTSS